MQLIESLHVLQAKIDVSDRIQEQNEIIISTIQKLGHRPVDENERKSVQDLITQKHLLIQSQLREHVQ